MRVFILLFALIGLSYSQCVGEFGIDTVTFNSGIVPPLWSISPGANGNNSWVINNNFSGGNTTLPSQPNGIISPGAGYAHVTCNSSICALLYPGEPAVYFDDGGGTIVETYLISNSYNISGYDSVKVSYWTVIGGLVNNDYGFVEYKLDNGPWQVLQTNIYGYTQQWVNFSFIITTANASTLQIRFGMRINNDGAAGDPSFCIDDVIITGYKKVPFNDTITVTTCQPYTSPSGNYIWTTSGTYNDTIFGTCDTVFTINLTINTIDTSITYDAATTTLTANATNVSYQWFDCNTSQLIPNATSQSFKPTYTGTFAVILTDNNNCKDTSSCYFVDITTNLNDVNKSNVSFYPTRVNEYIYITGDFKGGSIINLLGQKVLIFEEPKVYIKELPSGIYFVEVDNKILGKIVKE